MKGWMKMECDNGKQKVNTDQGNFEWCKRWKRQKKCARCLKEKNFFLFFKKYGLLLFENGFPIKIVWKKRFFFIRKDECEKKDFWSHIK